MPVSNLKLTISSDTKNHLNSTIFFYLLGCRGQHQNQGLDFIDTLTAPTLTPEEAGVVSSSRGGSGRLFSHPPIEKFQSLTRIRQKNEEKLTIITPSSVVVMSTARPRPTTISTTASVLQGVQSKY